MTKKIEVNLESIQRRIVLIVIAALFFIGVGFVLFVIIPEYRSLPKILASSQIKTIELLNDELAAGERSGFSIKKLRGISDLLDEVRNQSRELGYLILRDIDGNVIGRSGVTIDAGTLDKIPVTPRGSYAELKNSSGFENFSVKVLYDDLVIGTINAGIDEHFMSRLTLDRLFDSATILVVIGVLLIETTMVVFHYGIFGPLETLDAWRSQIHQRSLRQKIFVSGFQELRKITLAVSKIRTPYLMSGEIIDVASPQWQLMVRYVRYILFLFVLGDSISLSFIPLLTSEVINDSIAKDNSISVAMPVAVYAFFIAALQLAGPFLTVRYYYRKLIAFSFCFSALGFLLMIDLHSLQVLLIARSLNGIGAGLLIVTCQIAIASMVPESKRGFGQAAFTGTFFLANFTGMALGGILNQQFGYNGSFLFSITACAAGAFFSYVLGPSCSSARPRDATNRLFFSGYIKLFRNVRYLSLIFFCAIPNRFINTALLFYIAPLYLLSLDFSKSEIGRAVSMYGLTMAVAAPVIAPFIDRHRLHQRSVLIGSMICAVGLLSSGFVDTYGVIIAVFLMGIGQSISIPSQMSLIPNLTKIEEGSLSVSNIMSLFRIFERVPAFLAPFFAQLLVGVFGYSLTISLLGWWLSASVVFLLFFLYIYRDLPLRFSSKGI